MNAGALHRLARLLREIATRATTEEGEHAPAPGLIAVMEDLTRHPGSTITDLVGRTRLAQSFVSRTVAELREAGVVMTQPDPNDGRRIRVHLAPQARQEVLLPRGEKPLGGALVEMYPHLTQQQCQRIEILLDELLALLQEE